MWVSSSSDIMESFSIGSWYACVREQSQNGQITTSHQAKQEWMLRIALEELKGCKRKTEEWFLSFYSFWLGHMESLPDFDLICLLYMYSHCLTDLKVQTLRASWRSSIRSCSPRDSSNMAWGKGGGGTKIFFLGCHYIIATESHKTKSKTVLVPNGWGKLYSSCSFVFKTVQTSWLLTVG